MIAPVAYRHCEEVTRSRAGNFYYGIRLLPPPKRRAMCAVYAFARRIDDIGDGTSSPDEQLRSLERARDDVSSIMPASPDPVIAALGDAAARYPLPLQAFVDLIDGVEMDVRGERYPSFEALEVYCRRVAGSIGRLSVAIFGAGRPEEAASLSDDLGVAMQLTNVLRDLREDLARGRVYVPADDLTRFGCDPQLEAADPASLGAVVRFEIARARSWFDRGLGLLPLLDGRSASCVGAMTGIYQRILAKLDRRPAEALRGRISLPAWEKAWVAARSVVGVPG
ncbi:MAG: presqualene diphosphate synthase HpnD [Actinobacteria bacterium]|nr:MAG: presqualene diphosphate synthase HpnD [Actinomycetota bacterium]